MFFKGSPPLAPIKLECRNNIWHIWAAATRRPTAWTNRSCALKSQLQSRFSSVEVWIMWDGTTQHPAQAACEQMLPRVKGRRPRWWLVCSTSSVGGKQTPRRSANWIAPTLISSRWSGCQRRWFVPSKLLLVLQPPSPTLYFPSLLQELELFACLRSRYNNIISTNAEEMLQCWEIQTIGLVNLPFLQFVDGLWINCLESMNCL